MTPAAQAIPPSRGRQVKRRSALLGGAAIGVAAVLPAGRASADVSPSAGKPPGRKGARAGAHYALPRVHAVALPDSRTRQFVSRFCGGVTAAALKDVSDAGGVEAWFEQQLTPDVVSDHKADALWTWFPTLGLSPSERWDAYQAGTFTASQMSSDLSSWIMLRRLTSKRAVQEMMVDFWSNCLHVPSPYGNLWVWRVQYEEMIRAHALGSFEALLVAAIEHPAMGLYLNNVESTAAAINENLGRELLELHTVGVDAGYTQAEVRASAKILTGFQVDTAGSWAPSYDPSLHWVGRVKVLGFASPNAKADGRPVLKKYLSYLAHHPSTARRVCTRLALRFVSDAPSSALIDSLAAVYLTSETEIVPVLQALVASDEFLASAMHKLRTPVEDALATWAALNAVVSKPNSTLDAANQLVTISRDIGQVVYDWSTPDGFPDQASAWSRSGRVLESMRAHWMAASGPWPNQGISIPPPISWMPELPTTFDHVVDNLARRVLYIPCTSTMLQAACAATDIKPTDVIDELHPLVTSKFPWMMASLLDSVEHLSR